MPAEIAAGQDAILSKPPYKLRHRAGHQCHVHQVQEYGGARLARVTFEDEAEYDLAVNHLSPAPPEKSPRRSPLNLHIVKDDRSERQKQDDAVAWLRSQGYVVMETGAFRTQAVCYRCSKDQGRTIKVFCKDCGQPVFTASSGNTTGCPDLFIVHPVRWPRGCWTAIEMKETEKSERKPEQVALAGQGCVVFAWSLAMVLETIHRFEVEDPRIEPHPAIVAWLESRGLIGGQVDAETEDAA